MNIVCISGLSKYRKDKTIAIDYSIVSILDL